MVVLIDPINHIHLKGIKTIIIFAYGIKSVVDLMESSSEVHFYGVYMEGIEQRNVGIE
ncbi:hypothetical protein DEO72_LG10g1449 [Vigna unguiculata]|uniref:Uncharacterized protein n=1 Tax=Vigna unguiculata TaxID=3917 RepID=A0A4D6NBH0_VIGUN|nr:hypothetical protein DEO72_LG10g1449 [Vigna unguiculata]